MAKKRKNRNKPKPLLSVQGIVHLEDSFVPPSQDSGLLNTVGGDEECQGLVLAPNYGYGIPASTLYDKSNEPDKDYSAPPKGEEEKEIGEESVGSKMDIENETPAAQTENTDPSDSKELSVAVLVRHIGGAKSKPLLKRDVVEDRPLSEQPKELLVKDDAETSEFYESLGISRPNQSPEPEDKNNSSSNCTTVAILQPTLENTSAEVLTAQPDDPQILTGTTESIADYYKTYTQYYYSYESDPYGDKPLEFGLPTVADGVVSDPDIDQSIIEMARRAQRARRAYEAKKEAAEAEARKLMQSKPKEEMSETYDPLPMEIIPSSTAAELNITSDTTLNQYWVHIRESPHDFHRWTYLINYVETTVSRRF